MYEWVVSCLKASHWEDFLPVRLRGFDLVHLHGRDFLIYRVSWDVTSRLSRRADSICSDFLLCSGQTVIRAYVGLVDRGSVIGCLWDCEDDQEKRDSYESRQDPEVRTPSILVCNIAADDWR